MCSVNDETAHSLLCIAFCDLWSSVFAFLDFHPVLIFQYSLYAFPPPAAARYSVIGEWVRMKDKECLFRNFWWSKPHHYVSRLAILQWIPFLNQLPVFGELPKGLCCSLVFTPAMSSSQKLFILFLVSFTMGLCWWEQYSSYYTV